VYWVRVDNRLVHGQIIETWLPFTGARLLVVANDPVAGDPLQQEIMSLAIPAGVKTAFIEVEKSGKYVSGHMASTGSQDVLVLLSGCPDARRALDRGLVFTSLNVGNVHYAAGKRQVCPHVALSPEDEACLRHFRSKGIELDFRCVPNEPIQVKGAW
jgi:PTS system mannose-specific IIB component